MQKLIDSFWKKIGKRKGEEGKKGLVDSCGKEK